MIHSLSFAGKFNVAANLDKGIDSAGETDGLTVTPAALPGYPEGTLVVQDGYNRMPLQPQNFKIIDWHEVKKPSNSLNRKNTDSLRHFLFSSSHGAHL